MVYPQLYLIQKKLIYAPEDQQLNSVPPTLLFSILLDSEGNGGGVVVVVQEFK